MATFAAQALVAQRHLQYPAFRIRYCQITVLTPAAPKPPVPTRARILHRAATPAVATKARAFRSPAAHEFPAVRVVDTRAPARHSLAHAHQSAVHIYPAAATQAHQNLHRVSQCYR